MKAHGLQFPVRKAWNRFKASPATAIRRLLRILAHRHGPASLANLLQVSSRISRQYDGYHAAQRAALARLIPQMQARIGQMRHRPAISIVMPVFNVEERWLRHAIESARGQIYPHWELCIADDASTLPHVRPVLEEYCKLDSRIKATYREVNGHISAALNSALALAQNEFVALLDHDDELAPDALYEVALLLERHPEADFVYSDEDRLEADGTHVEPYFKPNWSPHLLLSINYITHLAVLRRQIVQSVGGFRDEVVGSQDYDLFLRFTEKTDRVFHIPKILYSWRKIPSSAALIGSAKPYAFDAAVRSLTETVRRRGIEGRVAPGNYPPFQRIRYRTPTAPCVSVVVAIPAGISPSLASRRLKALALAADPVAEVLVVGDGRVLDQVQAQPGAVRWRWIVASSDEGFTCEAMRVGADQASGNYLAFISIDLVAAHQDSLRSMLEYAQLPEVGCAGAKIVDRRGRLVHAGLALGIGGTVGSPGRGLADLPQLIFYLNQKDASREVSAVSGDCLMVARTKYEEVGGFNPEFRMHYFDVDLCLRLLRSGYSNMYTPYARYRLRERRLVAGHNPGLLDHDRTVLLERWGGDLSSDPYYNPNLTRSREDLGIGGGAEG